MDTKDKIENLEGEVWKPIKGYEGLYEVSNKGRVKSLNYCGWNVIRIMENKPSKGNYIRVKLRKNNKPKTFFVHRLVYEAFYGDLPKYEHTGVGNGSKMIVINHKDENPHNNNIENLEVLSHTENINYGTALLRRCESQKNKRNSKKVYQYTTDGKLVKIWPSTMECNRNGFNFKNVAACCVGKRKHCNGFIWSYTPLNKEQCCSLKTYNDYAIYQYTKEGELIKIWENAGECERNGYNKVCVCRCCKGKQHLHKGYIWLYKPLNIK